MKEFFRQTKFRAPSLALIDRCNEIIDDYLSQGLRLTLRQLYYQLVSANELKNEERSYKNLGSLVSDARLAGLMDWDAIEDRVRRPRNPSQFEDLRELVEAAVAAYRLPRWKGQSVYAELWVEKDALAGVLEPIANAYHVTLVVNRGYSSQSAMYESAKRFIAGGEGNTRRPGADELKLFYLGDHDPSGEDMVRDVEDRLRLFGVGTYREPMSEISLALARARGLRIDSVVGEIPFEVRKIALTMEQIRQYKPPPNPAKVTDSRAAAYIEKYGSSSWEVDALPPNVLGGLIRKALDGVVDKKLMDAVKEREKGDKARLKAAVEEIMGGDDDSE